MSTQKSKKTQKTKKIPYEEWQVHKPELECLWLKEKRQLVGPESSVTAVMEKKKFFATKSQYEAQFAKWKWNKNQKRDDWKRLAAVIDVRERQSKQSDVFIRGTLLPSDTVQQRIAPYIRSVPKQLSVDLDLRLPEYITIRTPTLDKSQQWTFNLPSSRIEKLLCMFDTGTRVDTTSDLGTSNIWDLAALKSVLPQLMTEEGPSSPSVDLPSIRECAIPLHRQILWSLANNFAGLENADIKRVICFLQKTTKQGTIQRLIHLISSDPNYSSRAIGQSIFKGALELGDAKLIDLLLNEKSLGIDVNRLWCRLEGWTCTPIELASSLGHEEVINVLLRHGSDVKRTYPNPDNFRRCKGALDYAVNKPRYRQFTSADFRIVRKLLNAGGDLSEDIFDALLFDRNGEIFYLLLSANGVKDVTKWEEWGIFHKAVSYLDHQTAMATIRTMITAGADLNFCYDARGAEYLIDVAAGRGDLEMTELLLNSGARITDKTLDTAAGRGDLEMTELLLNSGARITDETLTIAISRANHSLIHTLLDRGADVNSGNASSFTPLAEAIRLQNPEIIDPFQLSNRVRLDDEIQFSSAIVAASEVGNIKFIEHLVQLGGQARAEQMGCALAMAIEKGQDEAVAILIKAGADLNPGSKSPLAEAISRHDEGLVRLLLEEGAVPNENSWCHGFELQCAVEWGNHSIVETLIQAGAVVRVSPLLRAVKSRDQALVQLLLDARGWCLLDAKGFSEDETALQVALRNDDISMARYLLDWGANPTDTPELGAAMAKSPDFLQFVLQKHKMRHAKFPVKFGHEALIVAIRLRDEHAIRTMLERGLDASSLVQGDFSPMDFCSPFGFAIINSNVDVIELFLQKGCDPNSIVSKSCRRSARYSLTGLLAAIETRNVSKVKLLHRYEAKVNFPTGTGVKHNPLQEAAAAGSTDMVELLITLGAEVNTPAARKDGATALQFAAIGGHIGIAYVLIRAGADVNAPAAKVNGRTALEGAAEHGRLDMLQLLLNKGAGNGGKDEGQFARAIALARDQCHDYITDFLEDYLRRTRQEATPIRSANRTEDGLDTWLPNAGIESIDIDPMDRQMDEEEVAEHGCLDMLQIPSSAEAGTQDLNYSTDFLGNYLPQTQQEDGSIMSTDRTEDDFSMWESNGGIDSMDVAEVERLMEENDFSL